jgi:hypothetical protein
MVFWPEHSFSARSDLHSKLFFQGKLIALLRRSLNHFYALLAARVPLLKKRRQRQLLKRLSKKSKRNLAPTDRDCALGVAPGRKAKVEDARLSLYRIDLEHSLAGVLFKTLSQQTDFGHLIL